MRTLAILGLLLLAGCATTAQPPVQAIVFCAQNPESPLCR